jgi:superfamily II DNA or RNA helicase
MELRPYQKEAIRLLQNGFRKHKAQVLCLPTGSGKTIIFSTMVEMAAKNGTPTLVLTHRRELFEQTFKAIDRLGVNIQRINAETKRIDGLALVSVAMVETLERRLKKGLELMPKLIIIDEAHFGNFTKILDYFSSSFVIGATATPIGKHFHKYYQNIVESITISELIEQKYLCDYRAFQMQDDFSDVKKSKGEFDDSSLFQHFDKPTLYKGVIDKYIEKCNGKKAIVFNCNILHSDIMAKSFCDVGIQSYSITSKTEKSERLRILQDFHDSKFLVLNNCGILTTGYDEPSIEVVIMNRATLSLPLWLQCCGRGSRTYQNKTHFTVLDFGMNHHRLGMWNEQREWSLAPPKEKKEKAPPIKDCEQCGALCYASVRVCPFCGFEFISSDKATEIKDGILVEIKKPSYDGKKISECTISELIKLQKDGKYKATFIHRVVRAKGSDYIHIYAKAMGYKKGWEFHQKTMSSDTQYNDYTL